MDPLTGFDLSRLMRQAPPWTTLEEAARGGQGGEFWLQPPKPRKGVRPSGSEVGSSKASPIETECLDVRGLAAYSGL